MNSKSLLNEAVDYFSQRKIYSKLFKKFLKKYEGLGRFGGTVNLTNISREEKEELEGFLGENFLDKGKISISFKLMETSLMNSKFSILTWEEIISTFFNIKLISKKEKNLIEEEEKELFFNEIIKKYEDNIAISWFKGIVLSSPKVGNIILQKYKSDREELKLVLENIFKSIKFLPRISENYKEDYQEVLPIFAAKATGNPHYFDEGTYAEKLFSSFLIEYFQVKRDELSSYSEYKSKIWYEAGIIKDEVSNDVLVYGVKAIDNNDKKHLGIEDFANRNEPLRLTIFNMLRISKLFSYKIDNNFQRIYIVENPAIFTLLIKRYPERTIICGNGQIRRAVLMALDLFDNTCKFYYSGDYDPEGLIIAQKLKNRYGERIVFWKYEVEVYKRTLSDVKLDESRLKKLEFISDSKLLPLKNEILMKKKAVYQEQIIQEFIK